MSATPDPRRRAGARLLGALLVLLWAGGAGAEALQLTLLHTNGLRGRLRPHGYFGEPRGGIARLVTLIRAHAGDGAIVLDGGDALGPDAATQFDGGRTYARLLARAGYTALVPGNHDLNYGPDTLTVRAAGLGAALLAANVSYPERPAPVFEPATVVVRRGVRVLLAGVVSPGLAQTVHPVRARGMQIGPPEAALRQVLDGVARGADYDVAVVVAHMSPLEAMELARACPDVDLFVAGDNPVEHHRGGSVHVVELASGTRVVSTPDGGPFLGRVRLRLERPEGGPVTVAGVEAALIPVTADVAPDPEALAAVEALEAEYGRAQQRTVATLADSIVDGPQFVCDVMRRAGGTEIAVVNRGALRPVSLGGEVRRAHVDSLVRFDDTLVRTTLTGEQLRRMAAAAAGRQRAGQHLLFSGFDPQAGTVNGVPVEPQERYAVTTTAFLASGGDGHFPAATWAAARRDSLQLMGLVTDALQGHRRPLAALRRDLAGGRTWKATSKLTNSLALTRVADAAARYDAAAVRGADALAWSAQWQGRLQRLSRRGTATFDVKSAFGQLREGSRPFQESTDRLEGEALYTWRRQGPAPFVAGYATSAWTGPDSGDHPLRLRVSSGLHRGLGRHGAVRLGLGWEHDAAAGRGQLGVEVAPEYKRTLAGGNQLTSTGKLFVGATDRRGASLQQYNTLLIRLKGNLHAAADANLFAHWDERVEELATKMEVQVGLTWVLAGKRAARAGRGGAD